MSVLIQSVPQKRETTSRGRSEAERNEEVQKSYIQVRSTIREIHRGQFRYSSFKSFQ